MAKVTKQEQKTTIEELQQELNEACNNFVFAMQHQHEISEYLILRIRLLSEELLRWRIL